MKLLVSLRALSVQFAAVFMFALAGQAHADAYLIVGGSATDYSKLDTKNVGYFGEVGLTNGTFAGGIELSNHMKDGNETLAGAVNGRIFTPEWHSLSLYGSVGVGATFEGDPLGQAGAGIRWKANDEGKSGSFSLMGGYEHRCYPKDWGSFDCASNDGYAKLSMMLTF